MSLKDREQARARRMEPESYQPRMPVQLKLWVLVVVVVVSAIFIWYTWPQ